MTLPPKTVTSAANPAVKQIRALDSRKTRDETGLFVVEGLRHAAEAAAAGWRLRTVACTPQAEREEGARDVLKACRAAGGTCISVTEEILRRATGRDNAQSLVAVLEQQWHAPGVTGPAALALEGVRDPGNLGTILRTADAAGVRDVLLVGETCDPFSPEAVRASMGSFARARLMRVTAGDFARWRKGWSGTVVGTDPRAAEDCRAGPWPRPLLLLMGGERDGLSAALAALCDRTVRIPMRGGAESLNLAVATGIMLHEIFRDVP